MPSHNGFFLSLHRHLVNGRLKDIKRAEESWLHTPFSAPWIKEDGRPLFRLQGEEKARRLYEILNGITRIAGIIFGSQQFHVSYIVNNEERCYLQGDRELKLSVEPLEHPPAGYSFHDAVDTMTGQVIHEAAHLRESRIEENPFQHDNNLFALHHLAEDVITDAILAREFPGFEGYLLKYRHYLCSVKLSKQWGRMVDGRLQQLVLALRSALPFRIIRPSVKQAYLYMLYLLNRHRTAAELRQIDRIQVARNLFAILYDEVVANHWKEAAYLTERFVLGDDGPPTPGENGRNRGGDTELKPLTSELLHQPSSCSIDLFDSLHATEDDIARIEKQLIHGLTSQAWLNDLTHRHGMGKRRQSISKEESGLVEKLQIEQLISSEKAGSDSQYSYRVRMFVPPLYYNADARYREAVDAVRGQIISLRNQFAWANTKVSANQYELLTGVLDHESLYKAKFSPRLFTTPFTHQHLSRSMDICLIVDASHSMKDLMQGSDIPKYIAARRMAALYVEALEPIDSIRTWVYAYSAKKQSVDIQELYSPAAGAQKERIGDLYPLDHTPEYEALHAVAQHMRHMARPGVQQVYIVFSDGKPEDDIIPLEAQIAKIKKLTRQLQENGHIVIQVTLGPDAISQRIYPNCLPFPEGGYPELIRRFGGMLKKLLTQ